MRFRNILKTTFIFALVAGSMSAQTFMQGWDVAARFSTGNTSGALNNSAANNNPNSLNSFSFGVELTKGYFVYGLDYQYLPGNFFVVSTIPHLTFATTGAGTSVSAAGTHSTIVRKPEANLFNLNFLYRYPVGDFYIQGGARVSMNTVTETETGSTETWATTTLLTSSSAIARAREAKTTTFNPTIGIGKQFNERWSGGLNVTQSRMTFPSLINGNVSNVSKTGFITELSFGIKF